MKKPLLFGEFPNFVIEAETGNVRPVKAGNPKKGFTLAEMQRYVGGYIEMVNISGRRKMVGNEEGKLIHLPMNYKATALFHETYGMTAHMVGNVLIMTRSGKQ